MGRRPQPARRALVFNFRTNDLPNVKLRAGMTWRWSRFSTPAARSCRPGRRWTVVTADGSLFAWEHTIVVTVTAARISDRDF